VRLPSALTTVMSVCVWSNTPSPVVSNSMVLLSPSALVVLTVSLASAPSGLNALTSIVVEPSALSLTVCWVR
jgi:hypothetical protein